MAFLEFRGVSKVYPPGIRALEKVTFTVEKGEFVFLQGPTGAGKTTLFRLITQEERPTEGEIWFSGRRIDTLDPHFVPFLRQHLGVVFQDLEIIPDWTVYEHLVAPLAVLGVNGKEARKAAWDVLCLLGLEKKSTFRARWLSGGEKQKLCIGRALVHRPKLVLADEPTGNLDAASALEVLNLLWNLSRNDRVTVIVATHNEAFPERFPARTILLERGRIRGERC
uniref:ATP-binding cassette domain-containing protein n=1 Tax=Candidatus Caldatribacterium californiense TaxID=1454726 RepID=A0A7V3YMI4_9BACT